MSSASDASRFHAIIAGGGPTGMAMAHALSVSLGPSLKIALLDKGALSNSAAPAVAAAGQQGGASAQTDRSAQVGPSPQAGPSAQTGPSAMAISAGSKQMLDVLGIWPDLAPQAQPITEIEITDSSLHNAIRPRMLTYENTIDDNAPASYVLENQFLHDALRKALANNPSIELLGGSTIDSFTADENNVCVTRKDGTSLTAALLIAADGRRSNLRAKAGIKTVEWDHGQIGIVTIVAHEKPHQGRAVQHFLPAGPFAILPLPGKRSCITWSEEALRAHKIMALDDDAFRREIQTRFGYKLGEITLDGPRGSWPLSTHLARRFIARRFALIGDAAHGVHPIAGQGLNLAIRDVAALTEVLRDSASLGLDLGGGDALERYERWRRFDSVFSAAAFSGLNRLFSNDATLLRTVRDAGLGIVDRLSGLKQFFVSEAAGLTGDVPLLLKGVPLASRQEDPGASRQGDPGASRQGDPGAP